MGGDVRRNSHPKATSTDLREARLRRERWAVNHIVFSLSVPLSILYHGNLDLVNVLPFIPSNA